MTRVYNELNWSFRNIVDIPRVMPDLLRYKNISKLDLSGNKIRTLPDNLSFLKNLETLDLTGNPIQNVRMIIEGLSSLPRLTDLRITLRKRSIERDTQLLLSRLTQLKYLNGESLTMKKAKAKGKDLPSNTAQSENVQYILRQEDMEEFNVLVDCITSLWGEKGMEDGENVADEFNSFIKKEMLELGKKMKPTLQTKVIQLLNLKTLFGIYQFSLHSVQQYLAKHVDERVAMVLQLIYNAFNTSFEGVSQLLSNSLTKREDNISAMSRSFTAKEKMQAVYDELANSPIEDTRERQSEQVHRKRLIDRISETEEYKEAITPIESSTIISLEKKLLLQPKKMTSVQLRDIITEIYESKVKSDLKNLDARSPRKTMEQHVHDMFKTKFGLKNIIFETFYSFLYSLKLYSHADIKARVFLKILRNEIEEEFRFSLKTVTNVLRELLKMLIYGTQPYAQEVSINAIVREKVNSYISAKEAIHLVSYLYSTYDANEIIKRIQLNLEVIKVNPDQQYFVEIILRMTRQEKLSKERDLKEPMIAYHTFRRLVLGYIIESHETFIKPFLEIFRRIDTGFTGLINEEEFKDLVRRIDKSNKYGLSTEKMLIQLDPYSNDCITFSSCVTFLSNILVGGEDKLSLLCELHSLDDDDEQSI